MKKSCMVSGFLLLTTAFSCIHDSPNVTLSIAAIKSGGSFRPRRFSKEQVALLEQTLDNLLSATQSKGISASAGIPGKGLWCSTRGTTGNPSHESITPDLKFYAGSIGKMFTAVITLNLVAEGRLSLNSPVAEWFPGISRADRITINHLLTHTSGIASFDDAREFESSKHLYRHPASLVAHVGKKPPLFEPGAHFAYSNMGYVILGIIIERVTDDAYRKAVAHYITDKISLMETEAATLAPRKKLVVRGHRKGKVLPEAEDPVFPFAAGSIIASPKDLILFFQALMSGRLLPQDNLQAMFSDMHRMTVNQNTYYGKGIVASLGTPVGDVIGHSGAVKGFGASLFYCPQKNIFACVMMNDDMKPADPAMFRILETMLKW